MDEDVKCPYCGGTKLYRRKTRPKNRNCATCHRDFSITPLLLRYGKKPLEWYAEVIRLHELGVNGLEISRLMETEAKSVYVFLTRYKSFKAQGLQT